jgi:hypothetical protein
MGTAQFLALATLNVNASGKRYNADANLWIGHGAR